MLLVLLLAQAGRVYHDVPLEGVAATKWTHIRTCGLVTFVRKQRDGDYHITLDNGKAKVVAEIIPAIPLPRPRKGQTICVSGIARLDKRHGFAEVHPVERIEAVVPCPNCDTVLPPEPNGDGSYFCPCCSRDFRPI